MNGFHGSGFSCWILLGLAALSAQPWALGPPVQSEDAQEEKK